MTELHLASYPTRLAGLRRDLDGLDRAALTSALPPGSRDQWNAATDEAVAMLTRLGRLLHHSGARSAAGKSTLLTSRVLAAMGGPARWRFCTHLRRAPAQPAVVALPLRRVDCRRCAATIRTPPADEADRCDLCGSRGHITFWPVRWALSSWLVLGDMCGECNTAIAHEVGTEQP